MPVHDDAKETAQADLLQELQELKTVLDAEADDAIPTLSDVVHVPDNLAAEPLATTNDLDAVDAMLDEGQHNSADGIPVLDNVTADTNADQSNAESSPAGEQSLDQLLAAEAKSPSPFALIDSSAHDYDTSTAESLIEDGLNEALLPLTEQMDDEALRLVDELVSEHAELIRQELTQRLDAKSKELRANLAAQQDGEPTDPS